MPDKREIDIHLLTLSSNVLSLNWVQCDALNRSFLQKVKLISLIKSTPGKCLQNVSIINQFPFSLSLLGLLSPPPQCVPKDTDVERGEEEIKVILGKDERILKT